VCERLRREIEKVGFYFFFSTSKCIGTTALWTTGFWEHWRITTLWFFLEASLALHHTYHRRHFEILKVFFWTISSISVMSLHFLFDSKDIICCWGNWNILIFLLTSFYAKKTLNSELLQTSECILVESGQGSFCLWLKIRRISWFWVNLSSFYIKHAKTRDDPQF